MGWPRAIRCTRSWWVRPVKGSSESRVVFTHGPGPRMRQDEMTDAVMAVMDARFEFAELEHEDECADVLTGMDHGSGKFQSVPFGFPA